VTTVCTGATELLLDSVANVSASLHNTVSSAGMRADGCIRLLVYISLRNDRTACLPLPALGRAPNLAHQAEVSALHC